ncbi:protein SYM1, variant [Cryptococcus amylolentus CBS 6039]|uniref:Protein SYM1, variant n=1 Tax=Cryptococcus amylolentus CBS 6039 TaxID=1295533 RepID=A0A1E3I2X2_9TREE|nr:protein SYM1, variant [Cryptococcus amylolentus CBS 6039]ODN82858.1 protein SYM1, variant [Cryptococcus amylolentus CBS 6039]
MAALFGRYSAFLARRPLVGNMASSAVLFATGDVIAQQLIEKKGKDHDLARTGRIVVWGGLCFAPAVHVWFNTLARLPIQSKVAGTAARVALDQFAFAPFALTSFFTAMTLMEGKNLEAAKLKWNESFVDTLKANWMLFIPFQAINMGVRPDLFTDSSPGV